MRLQIARQPDNRWAVFDEDLQDFRLENASTAQVVEWFLVEAKKKILAWLTNPPPQMTHREMRVRAGRVRCSACDEEKISLETYRPDWPENRQRCAKCQQ